LIPNEAVSLLLAQKARRDYRISQAIVVVGPGDHRTPVERVEAAGARILFGGGTDMTAWAGEISHGNASVQAYRYVGANDLDLSDLAEQTGRLALVIEQRGHAPPVSDHSRARPGDIVHFLVLSDAPAPEGFEVVTQEREDPAEAAAGVARRNS